MVVSYTNEQVRQWDWSISTHADRMSTRRAIFHERRFSSVTFTSVHLYGNVYKRVGVARALACLSDFGLLVEQSSHKFVIPCLRRRWTAAQNLTPLALSSAEKSVTVQTNKQTKTVNDISTPCLSACVDRKVTQKQNQYLLQYLSKYTSMVYCLQIKNEFSKLH